VSLDLRGNHFSRVLDRDAFGRPSQVQLLHPDRVTVIPEGGSRYYTSNGKRVDRADMLHERLRVAPGAVQGMSAITYGATALGVNLAAEQFGADYFADGNIPPAVLEAAGEIDQPTAKVIKDRFMAAVRGNREPVVLGEGLKFRQISVNPNESQFLETIRAGIDKVAQFFEVPATMIGGSRGDSLTYANLESDSLFFLKFFFNPLLTLRERWLSRNLSPRGQRFLFDRSPLREGQLLERVKAEALEISNHTRTPDEIRAARGDLPLTADQLDTLPAWGATTPPPEKP
jgi:HK97 family phage portal protein